MNKLQLAILKKKKYHENELKNNNGDIKYHKTQIKRLNAMYLEQEEN